MRPLRQRTDAFRRLPSVVRPRIVASQGRVGAAVTDMRTLRRASGTLLVAAALSMPAAADPGSFGEFRTPAAGAAQAIGTYANGCVVGAAALPPDGTGYQVVRLSRYRFFGHPELVDFIEHFGRVVAAQGIGPVAIADVAQPRGGPMTYGHVSHESGLDADIWLRLDLPRLPHEGREALDDVSVVDEATRRVDPARFSDAQAQMIRLAARDPRVARIFVNPAIKLALCRRDWEDRSWLRVVRPWYGHTGHFHVRLHCPAGSPQCQAQAPVPAGEGCGDNLMSWFRAPEPDSAVTNTARPPPPPLPAACQALLERGE